MAEKSSNNWMLLAAGAALLGARALMRRARRYNLQGRRVLITGGSRGLGLVMARRLVHLKARIAICARDRNELERARIELAAAGGDILTVACDVTDREQVEKMVDTVRRRFGGIDVLINNAGVIEVGPMEAMEIREYEESMSTHFWGPLYTTLAVVPEMKRRGSGRIVNISSIGGKVSFPHLLPYCASKFALVGLSEGLRAELAKDGIAVTTVCPGLIRTGGHGHVIVKGDHQAEFDWFSLIDTLPLTSMSAERAADRIITAIELGKAEVLLSGQAKVMSKMNGLFPGMISDLLGMVNRAMPQQTGEGSMRRMGGDLPISHPVLTALGERAAAANNEMIAHARKMAEFMTGAARPGDNVDGNGNGKRDGNGNGDDTKRRSTDNEPDRSDEE